MPFDGLGMKQVVSRILLGITGLALALGVIETPALLHLVDYRTVLNTIPAEPWQHPSNRLDPVLLHLRRPSQTLSGVQHGGDISYYMAIPDPKEYPYEAQYDTHGFRNSQETKQADIAVIGDSFIEAMLTAESATVPAQLGEILQRSVVNLGQLWYGPQQEAEVVRRFALPLAPKVIVWVIFEGNDFTDFYRYQELQAIYPELERKSLSFFRRSFTRNATLAMSRLLKGAPRRAPAIHAVCTGVKEAPLSLYFYEDQTEFDARTKVAVDATADLIRTSAELVRAHGAALVIAYAPAKIRVYRPYCAFDSGLTYPTEIRREQAQAFASAVGAIGSPVTFLDLTPALQRASEQQGATYFSDDTHWSEIGHRAVAEAIAQHIQAHGLLGGNPT